LSSSPIGNPRPRREAAARAAAPLSPASELSRSPIASPGPAGAGEGLLAPPSRGNVPALSTATAQKVRTILVEGTSPATARAHAGDVDYFWAWAELELGLPERYPAPAAAVVQFIADHLEGLRPETDAALLERCRRGLAGGKARLGAHSLATIRRRLASLSKAHQLAGVANPCTVPAVRELLSRAGRREARRAGGRPRPKAAATRDVLEAMLATCGEDLAGRRDRALLLFGFASGGRRRSEIAAARCDDLEPVADGYLFRLRRSKTDQAGEGLELPVLGRAAWALAAWLAAAGLSRGPLFRSIDRHGRLGRSLSDRAVALIVQRRAALAGFDPRRFGGHSLRSGFVTTAGRQGVSLGDSMALSGHRSTAIALRYHQAGAVLRNPAARLAD
jgi:integrase